MMNYRQSQYKSHWLPAYGNAGCIQWSWCSLLPLKTCVLKGDELFIDVIDDMFIAFILNADTCNMHFLFIKSDAAYLKVFFSPWLF